MELSRIKYFRGEAENLSLAYNELAEIQAAFDEIDPSTLRDLPENATVGDQLDELEDRVGVVEKRIYSWVERNFGESEAMDPSWNIKSLAEDIENIVIGIGAEELTLETVLRGAL